MARWVHVSRASAADGVDDDDHWEIAYLKDEIKVTTPHWEGNENWKEWRRRNTLWSLEKRRWTCKCIQVSQLPLSSFTSSSSFSYATNSTTAAAAAVVFLYFSLSLLAEPLVSPVIHLFVRRLRALESLRRRSRFGFRRCRCLRTHHHHQLMFY